MRGWDRRRGYTIRISRPIEHAKHPAWRERRHEKHETHERGILLNPSVCFVRKRVPSNIAQGCGGLFASGSIVRMTFPVAASRRVCRPLSSVNVTTPSSNLAERPSRDAFQMTL